MIMDFAPVQGKPIRRDRTARSFVVHLNLMFWLIMFNVYRRVWEERPIKTFAEPFQNTEAWREKMKAANAALLNAELDAMVRSMEETKVVDKEIQVFNKETKVVDKEFQVLNKEGKVLDKEALPTLEESSDFERSADLRKDESETFVPEVERLAISSENTSRSSPDVYDQTLPPGWILGASGEVTAPKNLPLVFPNRRQAFQALCLLKSNPNLDKLKDAMFDQLEHEGWRASSLLPPGWIYNYQVDSATITTMLLLPLLDVQLPGPKLLDLPRQGRPPL